MAKEVRCFTCGELFKVGERWHTDIDTGITIHPAVRDCISNVVRRIVELGDRTERGLKDLDRALQENVEFSDATSKAKNELVKRVEKLESGHQVYDIDPVTNRVTIEGNTYIPLAEYQANESALEARHTLEIQNARTEGYAEGKRTVYEAFVKMVRERYGELDALGKD